MKSFKEYITEEVDVEDINESMFSKSSLSDEAFDRNKDRVGQTAISISGKEMKNTMVISPNVIAVKDAGGVRFHIADVFDSKQKFEIALFKDDVKELKRFL